MLEIVKPQPFLPKITHLGRPDVVRIRHSNPVSNGFFSFCGTFGELKKRLSEDEGSSDLQKLSGLWWVRREILAGFVTTFDVSFGFDWPSYSNTVPFRLTKPARSALLLFWEEK